MTIFERVRDALAALVPPVPYALEPFLTADGSLPVTYITYLLVEGSPELHADDEEQERGYLVQLSLRSVDGLANLPDVNTVMQAAGFVPGREHQLPKDPNTGHFGLAKEFSYLQTKE